MKWKLPPAALKELADLSVDVEHNDTAVGEAMVQARVRIAEAKRGNYYYRNNRGAGEMENGGFVRFGLCNDSERIGDRYKSGDLIGMIPTLITHEMVGSTIARFGSIEVKPSDWKFSGTKREMAQLAWNTLVNSVGGHARFTNHD